MTLITRYFFVLKFPVRHFLFFANVIVIWIGVAFEHKAKVVFIRKHVFNVHFKHHKESLSMNTIWQAITAKEKALRRQSYAHNYFSDHVRFEGLLFAIFIKHDEFDALLNGQESFSVLINSMLNHRGANVLWSKRS